MSSSYKKKDSFTKIFLTEGRFEGWRLNWSHRKSIEFFLQQKKRFFFNFFFEFEWMRRKTNFSQTRFKVPEIHHIFSSIFYLKKTFCFFWKKSEKHPNSPKNSGVWACKARNENPRKRIDRSGSSSKFLLFSSQKKCMFFIKIFIKFFPLCINLSKKYISNWNRKYCPGTWFRNDFTLSAESIKTGLQASLHANRHANRPHFNWIISSASTTSKEKILLNSITLTMQMKNFRENTLKQTLASRISKWRKKEYVNINQIFTFYNFFVKLTRSLAQSILNMNFDMLLQASFCLFLFFFARVKTKLTEILFFLFPPFFQAADFSLLDELVAVNGDSAEYSGELSAYQSDQKSIANSMVAVSGQRAVLNCPLVGQLLSSSSSKSKLMASSSALAVKSAQIKWQKG